jgi:hypothetical protein
MIMRKNIFILAFIFIAFTIEAQTNVQLLHQLVEDNKKEHNLQIETRNSQSKTTAQEEINRGLAEEVKNKYRVVKNRFSKIHSLIDAIGIGNRAIPIVRSIGENQKRIFEQCQDNPALMYLAVEAEKSFVQKSESLLNYLVGLTAVIGDLNQMANSDRRILYQHIIDELTEINRISRGMAYTLSSKQRHHNGSLFPLATGESTMNVVLSNIKH